MTRLLFMIVVLCCFSLNAFADDSGWISLTDGKSFDGWKASENTDSWTMEDGAFVAHGPRSHLFYVGEHAPFKNFEFRCKVKTMPESNGGIYFHSKYQETGWPKYGYEAQVNATHKDPKKSGSLYAVENVDKAPHDDNEWFDYHIKVDGKHIVITVNGETTVDFTEESDRVAGKDFTRILDEGTFAFQCHDPISKVYFKDVEVKPLP
ncbi:3-keto-disaccharide hydrolase [Calycomorphotria hydatis]